MTGIDFHHNFNLFSMGLSCRGRIEIVQSTWHYIRKGEKGSFVDSSHALISMWWYPILPSPGLQRASRNQNSNG